MHPLDDIGKRARIQLIWTIVKRINQFTIDKNHKPIERHSISMVETATFRPI